MFLKYAILLGAVVGSLADQTKEFFKPSSSPTEQSSFYIGSSNGSLPKTDVVPGRVFDRFIQIFLENTNYDDAVNNSVFQNLMTQGILLNSYYGVTHPSEPNYIAAIGGDFFGLASDPLVNIPNNVSTIIDLLEMRCIAWATYQENMPTDGYPGFNYTNPPPHEYTYYVRKHNPVVIYDSNGMDPDRAIYMRNFNDFAVDVTQNALPQWIFVTPNIVNDGHDTNVSYAGDWLSYWLVPLLEDPRFNTQETLIVLTFDENESYNENNKVFTLLLGGAIPDNLRNTTDDTFYTHYSLLSTVQNNWELGNLGRQDINTTVNNVFDFVASVTGYNNNGLTTENLPLLNYTGTYPGPLNPNNYAPWPAPTNGVGAGGGPTFFGPSQ